MSGPVSLGEVRQFLRLDSDAEDALLSALVRAATELAEAWLGYSLAVDWNAVPQAVRLGILRTVAQLYADRDAPGGGAVPPGAIACWAPWRQVKL